MGELSAARLALEGPAVAPGTRARIQRDASCSPRPYPTWYLERESSGTVFIGHRATSGAPSEELQVAHPG